MHDTNNNSSLSILQGRFASELSTGDELVLTEMVFAGVFKALR